MTTETKQRRYKDEPIQWHLDTAEHDRCPRCGSGLIYLQQTERMCSSTDPHCGTWRLPMSTREFVWIKRAGERIDYSTNLAD